MSTPELIVNKWDQEVIIDIKCGQAYPRTTGQEWEEDWTMTDPSSMPDIPFGPHPAGTPGISRVSWDVTQKKGGGKNSVGFDPFIYLVKDECVAMASVGNRTIME